MNRQQFSDAIRRTLGFLQSRKAAYQQTLKSPVGQVVLADLLHFCKAADTCVVVGDHDRSLMNAGRHEVWLRIQRHLNLTPEQLFQIYGDPSIAAQLTGDKDG